MTTAQERQQWRAVQLDAQRGVQRGDVAAMRRLVTAIASEHGVQVDVRPTMRVNQAYARGRRIVIAPITDETGFAVDLHELGHVLSTERCRGPLHRSNPQIRGWRDCVRCEELAWAEAVRLAPFSREMFTRLRRCLLGYAATTPAPREAVTAAGRMAHWGTYADVRLQRAATQLRLDRLDAHIQQHAHHVARFYK